MNAAPEQKGNAEPVTRLKAMEARGEQPLLPPNPAPHLVEWWLEIGPTAGDGALSWQDMAAWEHITGIELDPWEAKAIRSMSAAFINQRFDSRKPDCSAPYTGDYELIVSNRDNVAAKVKAAFRSNLQGKGGGGK